MRFDPECKECGERYVVGDSSIAGQRPDTIFWPDESVLGMRHSEADNRWWEIIGGGHDDADDHNQRGSGSGSETSSHAASSPDSVHMAHAGRSASAAPGHAPAHPDPSSNPTQTASPAAHEQMPTYHVAPMRKTMYGGVDRDRNEPIGRSCECGRNAVGVSIIYYHDGTPRYYIPHCGECGPRAPYVFWSNARVLGMPKDKADDLWYESGPQAGIMPSDDDDGDDDGADLPTGHRS